MQQFEVYPFVQP